ncbi:MAG: D-alanyl-D-alanine carboxypeptidase/D-alanyl-D-alanine-endopeptidase, partial [Thermoproteota archaeon]
MILFGILLLLACSYFIFRGLEMESKVSELSKSIDDLTRGIGGEVGVCVINERGELVYALNPDMKLIPASNVKLLTCAAALHILGPSYTYETKVCYSGTLVNGTLYGDIIVKGAGDPSITYEDIRKLAKNISSLIRLIEGDILVDEGIFDEEYVEESWEIEDLQYYYAARVSGLSVEKNVIKIVVSPGRREGDPARVDLIPKTSYVEVVNYVRTVGGDKSDVNARKVFDENKVILRGEIGVQSDPVEFVRTVEEPSLYFGNLLMESLELEGVVVRGTVRKGVLPEGAVEIGLIRSRPLSELVKEMMKRSDNMMADHLL